MSYHVGIDAGGTSSKIEVFNDDMKLLQRLERPGLQAMTMSTGEVISALGSYLIEIGEKYYDGDNNSNSPDSVACGLAGAGRAEKRREITEALQRKYPQVRWFITSDLRAAHAGSFNSEDGILIIAGTGSVVTGRHEQNWFRAGGYGHLVGDEGSGTELGRAALHAACHCWDGGPETSICTLLEQKFEIGTINELLSTLYVQDLPVSQFAPILPLAAEQGDEVAINLCENAVDALTEKALLVAKQMPESTRSVILHGGLFKSAYYKELFTAKLREKVGPFNLAKPAFSAPRGALLLMQQTSPT